MSPIREDFLKESKKEKGEVNKSEETEVHSAPPQPASVNGEVNGEKELEGKYDEFDDEIVVIYFIKQVSFPEWLENYKPELEKVGVPIKDILETLKLQVEQESASEDELLIEEKIVAVECPQRVLWELLDIHILQEWRRRSG